MRRLVARLAWLSRLLTELTVDRITPIPLKCDNQAAIYIAKNPVFHERTKHVELGYHFVREKTYRRPSVSQSCFYKVSITRYYG